MCIHVCVHVCVRACMHACTYMHRHEWLCSVCTCVFVYEATNPYLRCCSSSGKWCAVPHAIKDVCESIVAARFQFAAIFVLILEKKSPSVPDESESGSFHTGAIADCYTSPYGEKIKKRSK